MIKVYRLSIKYHQDFREELLLLVGKSNLSDINESVVTPISLHSLAGMLHKVGLLPACNHEQVPFAYKMYTQADDQGWKMSNMFKKTFSIDVDIDFLGVW